MESSDTPPEYRNILEKIKIEKRKLKAGPAKTIAAFFDKLAPFNPPDSFADFKVVLATSSSKNFTYPPIGITANCHRVPFLSVLENSMGPNPILKTSACTPHQRPTI